EPRRAHHARGDRGRRRGDVERRGRRLGHSAGASAAPVRAFSPHSRPQSPGKHRPGAGPRPPNRGWSLAAPSPAKALPAWARRSVFACRSGREREWPFRPRRAFPRPRPDKEYFVSSNERPPPEHFLTLIREQQRGRLKVYLGFAAGVGKT